MMISNHNTSVMVILNTVNLKMIPRCYFVPIGKIAKIRIQANLPFASLVFQVRDDLNPVVKSTNLSDLN